MSAMVVIVRDMNIHLDDPTSPCTSNFNDIILGCYLRQLVTGPTHEAGHTLDVVITNSCHDIKVDVDPPIYSDHSFISTVIQLQDAKYVDPSASRTIAKRNWKQCDTTAFKRDLQASDIVAQPIVDCDNFFDSYDRCLRTLVDKHAPFEKKTVRARSTAPWYS